MQPKTWTMALLVVNRPAMQLTSLTFFAEYPDLAGQPQRRTSAMARSKTECVLSCPVTKRCHDFTLLKHPCELISHLHCNDKNSGAGPSRSEEAAKGGAAWNEAIGKRIQPKTWTMALHVASKPAVKLASRQDGEVYEKRHASRPTNNKLPRPHFSEVSLQKTCSVPMQQGEAHRCTP